MYTIEFEAQIQNGIVTIPKEYSDIYQSRVKISVLVDDIDNSSDKKIYRKPPTELIGKIKFLDDIFEPIVDESDWSVFQ